MAEFWNTWTRFWRSIYHPLGFSKGYNFPLFLITFGGLMGFTLARFQYLDLYGKFRPQSSPGEWYWFGHGFRRVGITLHLGAILPCAFLVCFQFVPVIKHKLLLLHRINGYIIILLFLVSNAGALMITRRSMGGSPSTQAGLGVLVVITTVGISMAYYNIKRLQIDQHRAWMLRTFIYMGAIITLRPIMLASKYFTVRMGGFYAVIPCAEIVDDYAQVGFGGRRNPTLSIYPQCRTSSGTVDGYIAVPATGAGPENIGAAINISFGMALWIALFLHAALVEIYLSLTPNEKQRLRVISYKRQLAAGFQNPGSAGLTVEMFGDAPRWEPPVEVMREYEVLKAGGKGSEV